MRQKLTIDGGQPVRTLPFPAWPVWDEREEKQLLEAIDGKRTVVDIVRSTWGHQHHWERVRSFFERLWWYDQVVFDASSLPDQNRVEER